MTVQQGHNSRTFIGEYSKTSWDRSGEPNYTAPIPFNTLLLFKHSNTKERVFLKIINFDVIRLKNCVCGHFGQILVLYQLSSTFSLCESLSYYFSSLSIIGPCYYGGDAEGGKSGIADNYGSVIEGTYTDYQVVGLFSHDFVYSQFQESRCTSTPENRF